MLWSMGEGREGVLPLFTASTFFPSFPFLVCCGRHAVSYFFAKDASMLPQLLLGPLVYCVVFLNITSPRASFSTYYWALFGECAALLLSLQPCRCTCMRLRQLLCHKSCTRWCDVHAVSNCISRSVLCRCRFCVHRIHHGTAQPCAARGVGAWR